MRYSQCLIPTVKEAPAEAAFSLCLLFSSGSSSYSSSCGSLCSLCPSWLSLRSSRRSSCAFLMFFVPFVVLFPTTCRIFDL